MLYFLQTNTIAPRVLMPQAQVDTGCQPEEDVLMRVFFFFKVQGQIVAVVREKIFFLKRNNKCLATNKYAVASI